MKFERDAYSYRNDPCVPRFDDSRALVIFDGYCVLCSADIQWMLARDPRGVTQFAVIQSEIPRALYTHYGLDADRFDTFMVLVGGQPFTKWAGVLASLRTLPPPWSWLGTVGRVVPNMVGDPIYDWVQRNRFRWFGVRDSCFKPGPHDTRRFLENSGD